MKPDVRSRATLLSRPAVAYSLAVVLPILAAFITQRVGVMHLIPFGLDFLAIVLFASTGGLAPALVGFVFCVIGRALFPLGDVPLFPMPRIDIARHLFLLASAFIVSLIASSRHKFELRLRTALHDLQDRNDELVASITERKLTEAALLRSEKLAAMGRLASTIAHEINNPLEAVTNLLYLARTSEGLVEPAKSYLDTAEKELARLGNITRLTLGFTRNSGKASAVDLAETIEDVLAIFHHRFESRHTKIVRNYAPVQVAIAPHELRQIATNLIANAADAISDNGGLLVLSVFAEGPHAVLLVEDNGSGISPAHLYRIFDPFFTTKEEVGTGIGLWVTRELTEKNSGHVSVEIANLPTGIATRFRVELPLAPQGGEVNKSSPPAECP